ncbi:MAG: hypothetical protein ACRDZO_23340 [Egibacteraceae bacterium]
MTTRFRPAFAAGQPSLHHFVQVDDLGEPTWEPGHVARALCGAYVDVVEPRRPLWKAGGEPCGHCASTFDGLPHDVRAPSR